MDSSKHNKKAWDVLSDSGGAWSTIISQDVIENARRGNYQFSLSPDKRPIPSSWLGDIKDRDLLCLGGGGGQQAPILSAMGAKVTVFDLSESQLKLDEMASHKYGLLIKTVQGNMEDLSIFANAALILSLIRLPQCSWRTLGLFGKNAFEPFALEVFCQVGSLIPVFAKNGFIQVKFYATLF